MTGTVSVARFLLLLARPSGALVLVGAAIVAMAGYLVQVSPQGFDQTIAMALFLQMFSASTGYRGRLVRGHFDPILTGVARRSKIVVLHAGVSALPGAVLWLLLATGGWLAAPHAIPTALTPAGLAAFAFVSAMAWAGSLPSTRYAGGACWVVALFIAASSHNIATLRAAFLAGPGSWIASARAAAAALVCPFFLIADPSFPDVRVLVLVALAAVLVAGAGVAIAARFDGALTDAS